jgi:hypothetical protein
MYEDPDTQSNDDLFFTDTGRRKAVESQRVTSDLFDSLLEEEKPADEKKDEEGAMHNDAHNTDK